MVADLHSYPTYKPSDVEWLGDVPAHWEVHRLKHVAALNPSRTESHNFLSSDSTVTFLPMERVWSDGRIDPQEILPAAKVWNGFTYFRRDDVLVAKITPCFENGKGAHLHSLPTAIGFGSTEFHVLRAKSFILPQFLYRLTTVSEFRSLGTDAMIGAAGQQRVPSSFMANYPISLPPLAEQVAIVRYLDHADERIRRYISGKQKLIRLLAEEKQAVIHRAVTRGLDPNVRLKPSGVEGLGDVPAHWEVRRLKTLCSMKSGDGITEMSIEPEGEYPVYGGNGIRGYTSRYTHDGDFALIGRQGALCGNVHIACGRFWASEHAVVATLHPSQVLEWFGAILGAMNLNQYSLAAAQPGLAVERVLNLWLPVPPSEEQAVIATHIEQQTADIDTAISRTHRQIELLQEYRTRLIADVVTGKLDVRGAAANLPDPVSAPEPPETVEEPRRGDHV